MDFYRVYPCVAVWRPLRSLFLHTMVPWHRGNTNGPQIQVEKDISEFPISDFRAPGLRVFIFSCPGQRTAPADRRGTRCWDGPPWPHSSPTRLGPSTSLRRRGREHAAATTGMLKRSLKTARVRKPSAGLRLYCCVLRCHPRCCHGAFRESRRAVS